ncbi:protein RALF-like 24 [Cynara cardunculus var. scolymus]|uniref:Rapid ALkalinization Factor n=1 Tax=Cynara cardunculus var. scolymus TaxID=59895 RepID=A0A103XHU6_CYNCS|nr:protein RALF-like 24 [Cynara cardunculus var. scolymus]KVH90923.1 Rapid ALkalinization Factor [Cynara cardunculus var. scolymus]
MKPFIFLLFSSILVHTHFKISSGVSILDPDLVKVDGFDSMGKRVCDGDEMMESESSRRRVLLMRKRYISYETLRRDVVPCGTPGASYYNCRANGNGIANPYNRGCQIITRCARDAINT